MQLLHSKPQTEGFTVFDEGERKGLIADLLSDARLTSKWEFLEQTASHRASRQARGAALRAGLEDEHEDGDEDMTIEQIAALAITLISRYKGAGGFLPAEMQERAAVLTRKGAGGGPRDPAWKALARWEEAEWGVPDGPAFFADVYELYQEVSEHHAPKLIRRRRRKSRAICSSRCVAWHGMTGPTVSRTHDTATTH